MYISRNELASVPWNYSAPSCPERGIGPIGSAISNASVVVLLAVLRVIVVSTGMKFSRCSRSCGRCRSILTRMRFSVVLSVL